MKKKKEKKEKKEKKPASAPPKRTPSEVLFSYFDAMVALNAECMAADRAAKDAGGHSIGAAELARLRRVYASIREAHFTTRKRIAILGYGTGVHDEYDAANIEVKRVVEESKTRVLIEVWNSARKNRDRYVLVLRDGEWRIDGVKNKRGHKWVAAIL
jgi:hypothetical protein